MTRSEAYAAVVRIINDPQNEEKLQKYRLSSKEYGVGLEWRLGNAQGLLEALDSSLSELDRNKFEISFDSLLHHIQRVLRQENLL